MLTVAWPFAGVLFLAVCTRAKAPSSQEGGRHVLCPDWLLQPWGIPRGQLPPIQCLGRRHISAGRCGASGAEASGGLIPRSFLLQRTIMSGPVSLWVGGGKQQPNHDASLGKMAEGALMVSLLPEGEARQQRESLAREDGRSNGPAPARATHPACRYPLFLHVMAN
jgi:hypothetical protein